MKRALLTVVALVTWPLGASANALAGADAEGSQRTDHVQAFRQVDVPPGTNAARRVVRDESIRWSEPFYRYGLREPAMEEFAVKGESPGARAAAVLQPPH